MGYIYLLTSDGYRDSVDFRFGTSSLDTLKNILVSTYKEDFGWEIQKESIQIDETLSKLTFKYTDQDFIVECGRCYYYKIISV